MKIFLSKAILPRLWLGNMLLLVLSVVSACKKSDDTPALTAAPTLAVSTTNVVLNRNDASKPAVKLSWSAAAVNGMNGSITYFLQWDRKGNNFSNPTNVKIGKDSLSANYTHAAFNDLMSTLPADVPTPIELRLVGATSDGSVSAFYSNALVLTVTPYSKVLPPPYSKLWLVGSATPNGWDIDNSTPLLQDGADLFSFSYTGNLSAGEFKVATAKNYDASFYRPVNNHPPLNATTMQLNAGDPDHKWEIIKAGKYKITLNLRNLTVSIVDLTTTTPPPYSQLWLVGDATPNGWDIDNATSLTKDAADPFIFSYTGPLTAGEFKIPTEKNWDGKFYRPVANHQSLSDTKVQLNAGDPDNKWQITTAGNYKITLDIRSNSIGIVKL